MQKKYLIWGFTILAIFLAIFALYYLYYSRGNDPEGEECISLSTTLESGVGIDLKCEQVFEDYRDGFIKMYINFKKDIENDNKIYFDILTQNKELPKDWMEKSYMQIDYSKDNQKRIPIEENKENRPINYCFDLSESRNEEPNVMIHIYIGKDYFPIDKEIVKYSRNMYFSKPGSTLTTDAVIEFLFPSEWGINFCREAYLVHSIVDGKVVEKNFYKVIPIGRRRISSQPEPEGVKKMDYYMELEREFGKISLKDTKIGVILSVIIAIISLLVALLKSNNG